jgi:hypothetical protein
MRGEAETILANLIYFNEYSIFLSGDEAHGRKRESRYLERCEFCRSINVLPDSLIDFEQTSNMSVFLRL